MNATEIIAIDPGASGGIAILRPEEDDTPELRPMPKADTELRDLLADFAAARTNSRAPVRVVLERVPGFVAGMATPASALAKLHRQFGYIQGLCDAFRLPLRLVTPQQWQKAVGAGSKREHGDRWKAHLRDLAARLYPGVKGLTLKTADALLILHAATGAAK